MSVDSLPFEGSAPWVDLVRSHAIVVRRLFSTFARGWPGAGLFIMRFVAGTAVVVRAVATLRGDPSIPMAVLAVIRIAAGTLLVGGLWTPVAGSVVAAIAIGLAVANDDLAGGLLATIAIALVLIGPGAWSIDARLFGWKRIDVRERTK